MRRPETRVRGLLLDLDGTIADSVGFFYELTAGLLREAGLPVPDRATAFAAIAHGHPPTRFLPRELPERDEWIRRMYETRWPEWSRRYETEVPPVPGACEAIVRLTEAGLALALVTSSSGDLPFLERWGVRERFAAIVRRDDVDHIKPHPEPMFRGAAALGLDAGSLLAVGDTPLDVRAARAAGIGTIGVLTGAGTEDDLRAAGVLDVLPSLAGLPDHLGLGSRASARRNGDAA